MEPQAVQAVRRAAAERRRRGGFTLLEVLVALGVFVAIMGIVGTSLVVTVDGWDRGQRALDNMRRGEHVIDQLAGALRSTCGGGASTKRGIYAFQLVNSDGSPPTAELSWVTASPAFLPPNSPLAYGVHRIGLAIETLTDGRPALAVRSWPYLMTDPDQIAAIEPGFLAPNISGFQCRCYDFQTQDWAVEWTSSNALPAIIEVTLYVNSDVNNTAEPLILQRLIEMPLGATNVNNAFSFSLNLPASMAGGGKGKKSSKGKGKDTKASNPRSPKQGNQPGNQRGNMGAPPPPPSQPQQPQRRAPRGNRGGGFGF